jgi:hypothetical protein
MQNIVRKLIGKLDGLYVVSNRCWRVAKLFDICTPQREKISQNAARLYRNGIYIGECTIIYEVDRDLCAAVQQKLNQNDFSRYQQSI